MGIELHQELVRRLDAHQARIGIIGLGYVGLPLLLAFAERGFPVTGIDPDERKRTALSKGQSYLKHISDDRVAAAVAPGRVNVVSRVADDDDLDAFIICVPTPLGAHREPDVSYVISAIEDIVPSLRPGQIISLESTTYPGTTDEEIVRRVSDAGLKVGEEVFVVFSPEREDPGNQKYDTRSIPKVCGGVTPNCLDVGLALYRNVIEKVVPVSSARTAEMTKLLENIHRAVNIGLVNELKIVADAMGIDIYEVIRAAATKPFGFVPYWPGPGLGGHCIPIDPFYLTWKAREFGVKTRFIELAGEVNSGMPHYVISKITEGLNNHGKSVKGSRVLLLGLAYKKNVDDLRESPAIELAQLLSNLGAKLSYSDPYVDSFRLPLSDMPATSVTLDDPATIEAFDCIVLVTDHDIFDYSAIAKRAHLIIDSRGRFAAGPNIVRA